MDRSAKQVCLLIVRSRIIGLPLSTRALHKRVKNIDVFSFIGLAPLPYRHPFVCQRPLGRIDRDVVVLRSSHPFTAQTLEWSFREELRGVDGP